MENGKLTFLLSHLYMMNDANEGKLIVDMYFTESNLKNNHKKDLKNTSPRKNYIIVTKSNLSIQINTNNIINYKT